MTNKELKQKFPVGKLYQINSRDNSRTFDAVVNNKYCSFECKKEIFLLMDISCAGYLKIYALFSTGERGEINFIEKNELKLIQ